MSLFNSGGEESFDDMDMEVPLNYDNPDFMSSEFFDSVLSLENNMEDGFLLDDDVNVSSDASSEVFSPRSSHSESSDKNSSCLDGLIDESIISTEAFDESFLLSVLQPTKQLEPPQPQPEVIKTFKPQTKILIQNPNNKKVIAKPLLATQRFKGKPQFLKVNQITGGKGVILPLNMKSIKILKAAPLTVDIKKEIPNEVNSNVVTSSSNPYPPLNLTTEEKRLLAKEGIHLPTHHPLTKNEERELKRIRRKIRNKISAQDSRKRKKEYVDGLEERVKRGSEENKNLLQRVRALQKQNRTLIAHVNKLQALIKNSTASKATPSTCLMVVLLSALLVSLPNIKLFENKQIATTEQVAIRRSLLSSAEENNNNHNNLNMEEFLVFKDESKLDEEPFDMDNSTEAELNKMLEDMEKEYEGMISNNNSKKGLFSKVFETFKYFVEKDNKPELLGNADYGGRKVRAFLEPDVDDEYLGSEGETPPPKRAKFDNTGESSQVILTTVNTQMTKDK